MNPFAHLTERQAAMLTAFHDAQALSPSSSVSLHSMKLTEGEDLDVLLARGLIRRNNDAPQTFCASLSRNVFASGVPDLLRVAAIWITAVLVIGILVWLRGSPH